MDLGSLIVAALLSLGVIGTDAVINAGNISFNIQVTEDLAKQGYTPQLVDAMMDSYLREYVDFQSIVHPPQIRSAQSESVVSAVAASLNMKGVTESFQSEFGLNPVRLTGSLMPAAPGSKEFRFMLTGTSTHTGIFVVDQTSGSQALPQFVEHVAEAIVSEVEPYAAAVHKFNAMTARLVAGRTETGHKDLIAFVNERLGSEAGQQDSDVDHAALHNLLGITAMLFGDAKEVETEFGMAQTLDPDMGIPLMNLAVHYISLQRFDEALELAAAAAGARDVKHTPFLRANAYTVMALAQWGKGDLKAASDAFLASVKVYPKTLWGYYYWSELLDSVGSKKDAAILRARAQHNMGTFETYPEVCFVHMQVLPSKNFALKPIDVSRLRHVEELTNP
jgi:tetratricopeptide (TPR) repeat protein